MNFNKPERTKMNLLNLYKPTLILPILATLACNQPTYNQQYYPPHEPSLNSSVKMIDTKKRVHLQADPTMTDFSAFAEQVTNKMLSSPVVNGWGKKRPRIIVGKLLNNTDNENIRVRDIQDKIQEILLGSGLVRVLDQSATSFDYIIKSEISSTRQRGESNSQLAHFTLQLKLFTVQGELIGSWSDDLALAKGGRELF